MSLLQTLPGDATLLDALVRSLQGAAAHNPNDAVPPAAILWTDKERQWESLIPALRARLPLLTLGAYDPATLTGPAYWLRCAIAGVLELEALPDGAPAVIYLPGVARADLRAVESCPEPLRPLAELQYRGVFWSHKNGRDWTIAGFLQSNDGGLGIGVQTDAATTNALGLGLRLLAQEPLATLRAAQPLRATYIHELLTPNPGRQLLQWLNDPEGTRASLSAEEWQAFLAICKEVYSFRPEQDGPITGARKLGQRKGAWSQVWQTFAENPERYPSLIERLGQEQPTQMSFLEEQADYDGFDDPRSSWPAHNRLAEQALGVALRALADAQLSAAREEVLRLEARHGRRRRWVWARLDQSPLAQAMKPLADLAARTAQPLGGSTTTAFMAAYASEGWRTDHAFLRALAAVADASPDDSAAVRAAADALYRPWLEAAAEAFQAVVLQAGALDYPAAPRLSAGEGTCLLFVDALRFDLGMALADRLQSLGHQAAVSPRLAALPTVTPTAKPAVSPVADRLTGGDGFDTIVAPAGPRITAPTLAKLIAEAGYQVLSGSDLGKPEGRGWTEHGQIDTYGHNNGWMVAKHGLEEIGRLAKRINQLLSWGWQEVLVVTDHGWLLLPSKLPTAELPLHLTEKRKGRCARLNPGSQTDQPTVPWHWDPLVRMAIAPGIRCYEAGKVYEHGGLSPQECITPLISVKKRAGRAAVSIEQLRWRGLTCRVTLSGFTKTMTIDLRSSTADPASSIADTPKHPDPDGTAALFLAGDQDDRLGEEAFIVVTDEGGTILAQQQTVIGGSR